MRIKALPGKVLVTDLQRGARVVNGIIIPDDNGRSEGIRPRWGRIYAVGSDITDVTVGQWVLLENGRWTRMLKIKEDDGTEVMLWGIDWPSAVLLVSDEEPKVATWSVWA